LFFDAKCKDLLDERLEGEKSVLFAMDLRSPAMDRTRKDQLRLYFYF